MVPSIAYWDLKTVKCKKGIEGFKLFFNAKASNFSYQGQQRGRFKFFYMVLEKHYSFKGLKDESRGVTQN